MKSLEVVSKQVGLLFLLQMAAAVSANLILVSLLSQPEYLVALSEQSYLIGASSLLFLVCFISIVLISILVYPLLDKYSPATAKSYFAMRVSEAVIQLIGVVALLSLIPLSQQIANTDVNHSSLFVFAKQLTNANLYAYHLAMIVLGLGSLPFCYLLYRHSLIPRLLASLGLLGYLILATSSCFYLLGQDLGLVVTLPVFVFEVGIGFWLLFKGFKADPLSD